MKWFRAEDTFAADLNDGTAALVVKGSHRPETDELVKRDLDATAQAAKAGTPRLPLFSQVDTGADAPPVPEAKPSRTPLPQRTPQAQAAKGKAAS